MPHSFTIERLGPHHDRQAFSCGNASLDDFIRTNARKESELGYGAVFILVEAPGSQPIVGYYSLSSHSVTLEGIDAASRKKLPRYPLVPTTLIGRLARDLRFRGREVGQFLLVDALKRALQSSDQVASHAVTVDAIDGRAIAFYSKYGFVPLMGHPNRLYLPMASVKRLGL
jgi:predicted GNAT family N-acyltransferase